MSLPNIVLFAPSSIWGGTYLAVDGTAYAVSVSGLVTLPSNLVPAAIAAGFINPAVPANNAITAFATGGQSGATQLTAVMNRVSVCATAGDSVKLPVSTPGLEILVQNDGATGCDVFGQTGDFIGTQAVNTALRVPPGSLCTFACYVAGTWQPKAIALASAKYTKNTTSGATTAAAGDMSGAAFTTAEYSAVGAANLTTRTAAQIIADAGLKIGQSYALLGVNTSGGTTTIVAGTGVTLTGTMTLATNTTRLFIVTVTGAATITIQSVSIGTIA